jgi:uncharacterized membrane protein HdeD (DUF308 family)
VSTAAGDVFGTPSDVDNRFRHIWWLPLLIGVAWILVALMVLEFDISSAHTVAVLGGILLLAAGVNEFFDAMMAPGWRWVHAVLGVLFVVGGIVAIGWPDPTFVAMSRLFAWYLLVKGTFDIVAALALKDVLPLWGFLLAAGVLEIVAAFWAAGHLARSAGLLLLWVGFVALAKGITNILGAFQLRHMLLEP